MWPCILASVTQECFCTMGLAYEELSPSDEQWTRGLPILTSLAQCSCDQMQLFVGIGFLLGKNFRKRPNGCSSLGILIQFVIHPQAFSEHLLHAKHYARHRRCESEQN